MIDEDEDDNALFQEEGVLIEPDSDTPPHLRDLASAAELGDLTALRHALGTYYIYRCISSPFQYVFFCFCFAIFLAFSLVPNLFIYLWIYNKLNLGFNSTMCEICLLAFQVIGFCVSDYFFWGKYEGLLVV